MKFSSLVALSLGTIGFCNSIPQTFENTNFQQTFDLTASYVKRSIHLDIKNVDSEPQTEYYLGIDPEFKDKTAVVEARMDGGDEVIPVDEVGEYYKLTLPELAPGKEASLIIAQAITQKLSPLPETGEQDDNQFLQVTGPKYAWSPYKTKTQSTKVRGLSIENLSKDGEVESNVLTFGPYKNVKPFKLDNFKVRFEYPKALVKTTKLDREVWVSHWGSSVSFEETYWLKNFGTKLKSFSRLAYQRPQTKMNLNMASLKELTFNLKPNARDAYYTDLVGNVSTSHFRTNDKETVLELKPRYPVFGGWGYNFTIGWSANVADYVKQVATNTYLLKVPFIEGPADMAYDEANIKVVLPEGATNVDVMSLQGTSIDRSTTFSFLDTVGRPTVQMQYTNIIDGHRRGDIYVTYHYSMMAHLTKPISIATKLGAFFLITVILSRINVALK